jgi:hypothetical protein
MNAGRPSPQLRRALARRERAEQIRDQAINDVRAAILADLAAGVTQAQLTKVTGYSREWLRQLARAHEHELAALEHDHPAASAGASSASVTQ